MKIGDKVRLIGIPANLPVADATLDTPSTFKKCLGREFTVQEFNEIGWVELQVGSVTGSSGEKIWVEPEFLELVSKERTAEK